MAELNKSQKEHLLELISEGLKTKEINKRAAGFPEPFQVSRQQVDFYRRSRGVRVKEIEQAAEDGALKKGFALRERRVEVLNEIGELLHADLTTGGLLWLEKVKAVGSGDYTTIVDYKELNVGEINALRHVFDDIAKETGGRAHQLSHPGGDSPDELTDEDLDEMSDEELEAYIAAGGGAAG